MQYARSGVRNGLFVSPGVRINEYDQSIVPNINQHGIYNVLMFVQSDWGPKYQFIENGTREFQKYFGIPRNVNSVDKISYDQQYRLAQKNCNLWVFRLNCSDNPMHFQHLELEIGGETVVPVTQKYSGEHGNNINLMGYTNSRGVHVLEIFVSPVQGTTPLLEETFTSKDIDGLVEVTNKISNLITLSSHDFDMDAWNEIKTLSTTDFVTLEGGENSSRRDPRDFITEELLENQYEIKFTFLVTQAQLDSGEVNSFLQLQKLRKDFVILHEFMPEPVNSVHSDEVDEFGIPIMGWDNWGRFVTKYMESIGSGHGYTHRYLTDLSQSYLSIYHPWLVDSTNDFNLIPYPPSVHAMEVFLFTLSQGGEVWDQMAGLNRGQVSAEPINILTKTDSDVLYLNNINPIMKFQGQGTFVWGQKTHYFQNSQLSRLNQRMVAIIIEQEIQQKMKNFLFEPMIQSTFSRIESTIGTYLSHIQTRNGIVDYAYELDIRPEFIERNYLPIKIRFIPTKSLEFIEIRFVVKNYSQEM